MSQPKPIPARERESFIWGMADRLLDHHHAEINVVLAPAKADGSPDWGRAAPETLENLPYGEWPDDDATAARAAVLVDQIDGCHPDTAAILWLSDDGTPHAGRIAGPIEDGAVAEAMIARDIGAEPPKREPGNLAMAAEKLRQDLFPLKADNDNNPPADSPLRALDLADLAGKSVPARQWYIEGMIPARNVTLLSGDGGTGKSLLALQIAVAGALGIGTLDLKPKHGRTLVLAAEDDQDEVHRRIADICREHGVGMAGLADRLRVYPLAGENAELARPDIRSKVIVPTKMYEALLDEVATFRPDLVVLDTSADLFGGDEVNRAQVRQFVGLLRAIAIGFDTAVLLLSHPSVQGMQTGTGLSGSTAWNNSVRSRLYLTADRDDDDLRVLKGMKSNYGRKGDEMRLRWQDGAFVLDDGKPSAVAGMINKQAEKTFLSLLSLFNRNGQTVSDASGSNYAPKKFSEHPDATGVSKKALAEAMQRLLDRGDVKIIMVGKPSAQRKKLVVTAEDFGQIERTA